MGQQQPVDQNEVPSTSTTTENNVKTNILNNAPYNTYPVIHHPIDTLHNRHSLNDGLSSSPRISHSLFTGGAHHPPSSPSPSPVTSEFTAITNNNSSNNNNKALPSLIVTTREKDNVSPSHTDTPRTPPSVLPSLSSSYSPGPSSSNPYPTQSTMEENSSIVYETNSFSHRTNISTPDTLPHDNGASGTYNSITGSSIASDLLHQRTTATISPSKQYSSHYRQENPYSRSKDISLSFHNTHPSSNASLFIHPYVHSPSSLPITHSNLVEATTNTIEEHNYLTVGSQTDAISFLGITAQTENSTVEIDDVLYSLPSLFGIVEDGVYRCGYPTPEQFPFLHQLRIRTVINLLDKLPPEYQEFLEQENIQYIHNSVKGNKAHCEEMDRKKVAYALSIIMDVTNHPILIHCRSGKHRTGALVGCLRMLQRWSLEATCDEYVYYCKHKQRYVDKQYIERFNPQTLRAFAPPKERLPPWLPIDCTEHVSVLQEAIEKGEISPEEAEYGLPVSAMTKGPDEPGIIYQAVIRAHVAAAVAAEVSATAREKAVLLNAENEVYLHKEEASVLYERKHSKDTTTGSPHGNDEANNSNNTNILRTPTKKGPFQSVTGIFSNTNNNNEWLLRDPSLSSSSIIAPGSGNSNIIQGYLSASPKEMNNNVNLSPRSTDNNITPTTESILNTNLSAARSPRLTGGSTLTYDNSPSISTINNNNGSYSNRNTISNSNTRSTILPGRDGASIFTPPRIESTAGGTTTNSSSSTSAITITASDSVIPSRTSVMNSPLPKGSVPTGLEGRISPINFNSDEKKG